MNYRNIVTALIHGGVSSDPLTKAVNVPVYLTSTFGQSGLRTAPQWEYSRTGNPTRAALESLLAELEHGDRAFAFASGMAAITAVLMLFKSGDRILISKNVYGGTFRVLDKVFNAFGLQYAIVDTQDEQELNKAITKEVKAVFIETPANPLLTVTDLKAIADLVHRHGILAIADNTFMTPYLQRPIDFGFDLVVHSATKYLGGHSDLIAGAVISANQELSERLAFIQNSTGGVLDPFNSYLLIRSIKTLGVRMDRHTGNAKELASFLRTNPAVLKVYYPGFEDFPLHDVHMRQAKNGGAMISFELRPEYDIESFFKNLKLITLAESLGGVESLVCHPASMTHASIPNGLREQLGITENLVRLSVGIEDLSDLKDDLTQALQKSLKA